MRIAVFADEIDRRDPARAIRLAAAWGVGWVELRSLPGGRFPAAPDDQIEEFGARVRDAGLAVSGVSPGLFKGPVDDPAVATGLAETLPRACEWARHLGTERVSCFGFARQGAGPIPDRVVERLAEMAAVVRAYGCRLALENEAACWGDTGAEAGALVRRAGAPGLGLCWDPGNAARAGSARPFPDEYRQIADLVVHVHAKNYDPQRGRWSLIESGAIDWPDQLRALAEDQFAGFLVIETHLDISPDEFRVAESGLDPLSANTRRNLEFVRACLRSGSG